MKNIIKSILACVLTALLIAGVSWAATLLPVSQGGTGASTASGARSNLGLGTIATQNVGTLTNTKYCTYATGTGFVCNSDGVGSMTYPGAGIAVSTGSAWDTSITNNSANWNTAYGWGNHASAGYLTSLSGALLATGATTGATSQAQAFTNGVITGKIYPSADSTTALQFNKADGTTNVLNIDTTNGNVGIGTTSPTGRLHLAAGTATAGTAPLKLTSGTSLTTPEAGAIEFDGTNLYFTPAAERRTIALTSNKLSDFAETTSAELAGVISGETGSGALVFGTSPTFTTGITTPTILASANDSGAIGASGTAFSDLFLASGAVINFNAGNVTLTHSADTLTMGGNIAFDTTARTIAGIANGNLLDKSVDTISDLLAPTADFSMNTHKITNVVDPTADQDVATKKSSESLDTFWALMKTRKWFSLPLDTYDMFEKYVSGSGATSQGFKIASVNTGITAGSCARQNLNSQEMNIRNGYRHAYYLYLNYISGNSLGFVGCIKETRLTQTQNNSNLTTEHAGIFFENGQWYASCANGTTQTKTAITISGAGWLEMIFSASDIKFYWQGNLVATLTTNLPSSYGYWQAFVHNKDLTSDQKIYFYQLNYIGN